MLRYFGEKGAADKISNAITRVIAEGKSLIYDLGGKSKTTAYTEEIISALG